MSDIQDYTDEVQHLFLQFLISEPDLFARCLAILDSEYFSRKFRPTVDFLKSHTQKHNTLPMLEQIQAVSGLQILPIENVTPEHQDWFLGEFETFCKHKALEKAIIDSTDDLEKKNYGAVEDRVKRATQIGLVKDLGLDYFENPKERLEWIKAQAGATSTGWKGIDQKLYGGLNRGEITIFAAPSGGGKSLFLQNLGVNWSLAGLNVVYISLELSEQLISMRLDSMVSGYAAREIMKNMDDVDLKVRMKGKGKGKFRVKYMPSGSSTNDVKVFVREYEIQSGIKVDAILVDYLDLMAPNNAKISAENLFIKDKYVSEELRNMAMERQIFMVTASQLGRCLALDTKVISNGRKIEIKDVSVGDWLESNEGPVRVTEKLPVQKQKVYKIKTKSGKEIICSGNHMFPVGNSLKTINSGLQVGDKLTVLINNNNSNSTGNKLYDNQKNEIEEICIRQKDN